MTAATLMISPPGSVTIVQPNPTIVANGNSYSGGMIAAASGDVSALTAEGYISVSLSGLTTTSIGPTSARPLPTNAGAGAVFLDTTLDALLVSDGLRWRNVVTGQPV